MRVKTLQIQKKLFIDGGKKKGKNAQNVLPFLWLFYSSLCTRNPKLLLRWHTRKELNIKRPSKNSRQWSTSQRPSRPHGNGAPRHRDTPKGRGQSAHKQTGTAQDQVPAFNDRNHHHHHHHHQVARSHSCCKRPDDCCRSDDCVIITLTALGMRATAAQSSQSVAVTLNRRKHSVSSLSSCTLYACVSSVVPPPYSSSRHVSTTRAALIVERAFKSLRVGLPHKPLNEHRLSDIQALGYSGCRN